MSIAAGLVATNYRGVGRQVELGLGRSNLVTQRRKIAILDGANAGIVGRLGGEGQFPVLPAEFEGWQFADRQVKDLENQRARSIRTGTDSCLDTVRQLLRLKGIGAASAWLFVMEVFAWRDITNRRQMGSIAGLTPTPYTSSTTSREQGISKAGNRRLRAMAVEIAWMWVLHQPQSELTKWFLRRFGTGSRLRKIGIVAVARKLLVALWRYLKEGTVPPGAVLVDWKAKMNSHRKPVAPAAAA